MANLKRARNLQPLVPTAHNICAAFCGAWGDEGRIGQETGEGDTGEEKTGHKSVCLRALGGEEGVEGEGGCKSM